MEPKDFYFQLVEDAVEEPSAVFLITPKKYYDKEGCISDESGVADEVLPEGFGELMESHYEFDGNPKIGRDILINIGMTEINFGLTPGEPSAEPDDEEGYDDEDDEDNTEDLDDLDELLKDDNKIVPKSFDYANLSTDQLMRHKKMMISTEDYLEAAKIQNELNSRE